MKLYDLPAHQKPRPKIYGLEPGGYKDGYIEFDHIDGAFSYCIAYTADGEELGVCHLSAFTPLTPHNDGYTLAEEPTKESS